MSKCIYGKQDAWFVADFETTTSNTNYYDNMNDSIVLLANSTNWKGESFTFTNIQDWLNFHIELGKSQTVFFHNLSFDAMFLVCYLDKLGIKPWNDEIKRSCNYELFTQGNKVYSIRLNLRKRINGKVKDYIIMFRCSLRMLNSSVGALGKALKLEKHHPEDDKITNDNGRLRTFYDREPLNTLEEWESTPEGVRYVEYCKNDCEIVRRALNEFVNAVNSISFVKSHNERVLNHNAKRKDKSKCSVVFNPLNYLTTASLTSRLMKLAVIDYVQEHKLKDFFPLKIENDIHKEMQNWFCGGFTQFNDKFSGEAIKCGKSMMLDVSSAYPYQMTFPLPYGELLDVEPLGEDMVDYYTFYEIKVKSAKIKPKYYNCAILKKWSDEVDYTGLRYTREQYNFTCYYTNFEWAMITKFYDVKVEWIVAKYMLAAPYLKEYANELYNLKSHYSKTKQDGLKQATKILINAGYGCLAKRLKYDSTIYYSNNDIANKFFKMERNQLFSFDEHTYKFHFVKDFNLEGTIKKVVCESTNEKEFGTNKAAAAIITSRERVYLWDLIDKIGAEHFGYSDTDSILFVNLTEEKYKWLKEFTTHQEVKLGDWEQEYKDLNICYFGSYGAKKYQLLDENKELIKFRFAGVSDSLVKPKTLIDEVDFNNDTIIIKGAVLQKVLCKSGVVLVPKDKIMSKGNI